MTWLGMAKIGVAVAMINSNLKMGPLVHCITVSAAKLCIFGAELSDTRRDVAGELGAKGVGLVCAGGACDFAPTMDGALAAASDEKGNMVVFQGIISDFVFTKGIPYNTSGFTPPPPGWTSNRSFVNGPVTKSKLQGDSFFAQTFNPATDVLSSYVNSGEALVLTTPSKVDINSIATSIGSNSNMTIYSFITASSELSSADVKVLGAIKSSPAVTAQAVSKVFLRIDQRSRPGVVSGISVTKVTLIKNGVAVPFAASNVFSKQQACSDANPANLASGSGVFIVCNPTDPWLYVDVTGLSFDSFNVSTRSDSAWQQYQCRSSDIYCTPEYFRTAISMYNNVTGTYMGSSNPVTAAQ
jgi:hypothetical protein